VKRHSFVLEMDEGFTARRGAIFMPQWAKPETPQEVRDNEVAATRKVA
jgi:hypothetical protein